MAQNRELGELGQYLTVNTTSNVVSINAVSISVGNSSVNVSINSTAFTGTSNNTSFVGSISAANVVSNAQLTSNLSNYVTATNLTNNLSNYQTTAGLSSNVATLTANNATNLNGQSASFYTNASNITTGTLSYAQIPANIINTTAAFTISGVHTYNANIILGTSGLSSNGGFGTAGQTLHSNGTATYWAADDQGVTSVATGNGLTGGTITSTGTISVIANTGIVANATGTYVNSAYIGTLTANNATNLNGQPASYYTNASNITTGTLPYAQIPANIINTTAAFTITGIHTYNANVILGTSGLSSNGSFGTATHVLHSNGTATYWAADDQGVTSVATGNGLTGGTITSTGTISVIANNGLSANATGVYVVPGNGLVAANSTGVHVGAGSGITVNTTAVAVLANTGLVANATGLHVNSSYWNSGNDGAGSGLDADLLDGQQGSAYLRSDVSATNSVDLRAPIFYDSNNTAYYLDPASTSVLNAVAMVNMRPNVGVWHTSNADNTNRFYFENNGRTYFGSKNGYEWRSSTDGNIGFLDNSGNLYNYTSIRSPIFYDSNDTNAYFDGTAPGASLVLRNSQPTITFRDTDNNSAMIHVNSNLFYILRGGNDTTSWTQVNGVWPFYIDLTNNNAVFGGIVTAASYNTTSDKNLKNILGEVPYSLDKLNPTKYTLKTHPDNIRYGFIAQEVQEHFPELVSSDKDGKLSLNYVDIIALLVKEVKELKDKIQKIT